VKWSIKSDILNFFGEEFMFTLKHNFRIKCELGPGGIRSGILCWEKKVILKWKHCFRISIKILS
jgi:hypothetical protein